MRVLVVCLFLTACLGATWVNAAQQPLNIILFLVDDLGWRDVGCYGSSYYHTPHMDRLASEGVRFTDAYAACPVCSPTRAAILTGKYPARLLLTNWLPSGRWNPAARLREGRFLRGLPLEECTLPEALRRSGYETMHIGKWHLGSEPFSLPEHHGFDKNIGGNAHGAPGSYFFPYEGNWSIPTTNQRARWMVLPSGQKGEYLTDRLTDEAVKFLMEPHEKPFFLYFSHYAVHSPLQAKPDMMQRYDVISEKDRQGTPAYAAMVESVDESLGRLLEVLDKRGIRDQTLVIVTSDNGGFAHATSNAPLRANKGSLYEGGIRVPLLIRWPNVASPGSVCTVPVTSSDLYPTCLTAADCPLHASQHIDGCDLSVVLKEGHLERDALYWHFPHYNKHPFSTPGSVIRRGRWKLIDSFDPESKELYDLETDIGEQHNLASTQPVIMSELLSALSAWRKDVDAERMLPNSDYDPVRAQPKQKKQKKKAANPRQ